MKSDSKKTNKQTLDSGIVSDFSISWLAVCMGSLGTVAKSSFSIFLWTITFDFLRPRLDFVEAP